MRENQTFLKEKKEDEGVASLRWWGGGLQIKTPWSVHGPAYRAIHLFHWRARADEHIHLRKLGTLVTRKRVPSLNSVTL